MQQSTTDDTRTLVVVRHAKAESGGQSDHERPLAGSGHADAAEAGRWLAEQRVVADAALVSDARRTQETWVEIAGAAGWGIEPELSDALYAAGPDSALDLVRETAPDARTLVVVGHNPTMAYLAELIDDGEGDDDAINDLASRGFPTASLVVFRVAVPWSDLGPGSGEVLSFHVGEA